MHDRGEVALSMGVGASWGVALSMVGCVSGRWHISGGGISIEGVDFGPYLVDGWQGGWHPCGEGEAKVSLLEKPLLLQYYFARFSKAAK